jgi:hypothetical protein
LDVLATVAGGSVIHGFSALVARDPPLRVQRADELDGLSHDFLRLLNARLSHVNGEERANEAPNSTRDHAAGRSAHVHRGPQLVPEADRPIARSRVSDGLATPGVEVSTAYHTQSAMTSTLTCGRFPPRGSA